MYFENFVGDKPVDRCFCVENCLERKMKIIHKPHSQFMKSIGKYCKKSKQENSNVGLWIEK